MLRFWGTGNLWVLVSEAMQSMVYRRVLDVLDREFGYLGVQSLPYWEIMSTDWEMNVCIHRGNFWVYPGGLLDTAGALGWDNSLRMVGEDMGSGLQIRLQGQWQSRTGQHSLDLLVDGFQLLLKHDGQCLDVSLSTGGQKLSPKHPLCLLLI